MLKKNSEKHMTRVMHNLVKIFDVLGKHRMHMR